ncbi:MAG: hypothetical protein FWG99_01890 [Treponema sp.]|nr:hypothetical protein [Treponema sp.]
MSREVFESDDEIDDYLWDSKIPPEYAGTWETLAKNFPARRVFAIRSDGSGYVYRSSVPGYGKASYKFAASGLTDPKLMLVIDGVGRCMYDCSINSEKRLELTNPVVDGARALSRYSSLFSPFKKTSDTVSLPFDVGKLRLAAVIPGHFTGTWKMPNGADALVINADRTGKAVIMNKLADCHFAVSEDNLKLLLTFPIMGARCLYDISPAGGRLILSNPVPDAGGETLVVYASLGVLTKSTKSTTPQ